MKRIYLPLIIFLFLIMEGVALELLPVKLVSSNLFIIPHWVLVFLAFIAIFYDLETTHLSVFYAIIFGLVIDIVYTGVLGVYMFTYAISIYIIHGLTKYLHSNIFSAVLLGASCIILADIAINSIYFVVGMADIMWKDYFVYRLLPTLLANLLFLIVLYPAIAKRLVNWRKEQLKSNSL